MARAIEGKLNRMEITGEKSAPDLKDHLRQAKQQKVVAHSMATKAQAHSVN